MFKTLRIGTLVTLLLTAAGAHAQEISEESGPARKISAGLLFGNGFGFDSVNGWAIGVGARGGYNVDKIYLGARFVYHFGETLESSAVGISLGSSTINLWEAGVEGGYDFRVARQFTLRPEFGAGVATRIASTESAFIDQTISTTLTNPYIAFGASGLYDLSSAFFLGLNGRLQLVVGDGSPAAVVLMLNGGMRF